MNDFVEITGIGYLNISKIEFIEEVCSPVFDQDGERITGKFEYGLKIITESGKIYHTEYMYSHHMIKQTINDVINIIGNI